MFPQISIGAFLTRVIPLRYPTLSENEWRFLGQTGWREVSRDPFSILPPDPDPDPPTDSIGYSSISEEAWRGITEEEWRSMMFLPTVLADIDFRALSGDQWKLLTEEQWRGI